MNLYTIVYWDRNADCSIICRVWANDLDSVIKRGNNELGRTHFILEGHPEILTHTAELIPTYDWGNPN